MQIDGQSVAVITGAASGIGRALAIRLAREGAPLAIADVDEQGLAETARLVDGSKVTSHILDVADRERFAGFVDEVVRAHGRVNLVVNNAGVALAGSVDELSIEDIEWLIGINFWGVIYGTKMFLPVLQQQPQAHIVNISSIFGIVGIPGHSAYVASKFAVRGFSESMRNELQTKGSHIRISVVHPGGIQTNIARNSRLGTLARPESHEAEIRNFERIAATSPEAAAERIVRGILRNENRILVGLDAAIVERIQRWAPVRYWHLLQPLFAFLSKK